MKYEFEIWNMYIKNGRIHNKDYIMFNFKYAVLTKDYETKKQILKEISDNMEYEKKFRNRYDFQKWKSFLNELRSIDTS